MYIIKNIPIPRYSNDEGHGPSEKLGSSSFKAAFLTEDRELLVATSVSDREYQYYFAFISKFDEDGCLASQHRLPARQRFNWCYYHQVCVSPDNEIIVLSDEDLITLNPDNFEVSSQLDNSGIAIIEWDDEGHLLLGIESRLSGGMDATAIVRSKQPHRSISKSELPEFTLVRQLTELIRNVTRKFEAWPILIYDREQTLRYELESIEDDLFYSIHPVTYKINPLTGGNILSQYWDFSRTGTNEHRYLILDGSGNLVSSIKEYGKIGASVIRDRASNKLLYKHEKSFGVLNEDGSLDSLLDVSDSAKRSLKAFEILSVNANGNILLFKKDTNGETFLVIDAWRANVLEEAAKLTRKRK